MCDDRRRMRALGLLMGAKGVEGWIGRFVSSCSEKTDDVGPCNPDGAVCGVSSTLNLRWCLDNLGGPSVDPSQTSPNMQLASSRRYLRIFCASAARCFFRGMAGRASAFDLALLS
eukprot:CAMPEP_0182524782 /NCGR_PEP_ID=MMETSP1323-20130603/2026_1 /TAXON_ID=236787 /ORGANISM="Florenciella parvula, Strain RCC1693" /LENGTH=114 /DNA_ID=CAMNT_0024733407 /DNA_START=98 /DNA_END=442 /DNA_ORIENTATION=+